MDEEEKGQKEDDKDEDIETWSEDESWDWNDPRNWEQWENKDYKDQEDQSSSRSGTWKRARSASSWNIQNINPVYRDSKKRKKN